jgi:hypothetical protein
VAHPIGRILSPQDRGVRLLTRNGKDWTGRFPTIVDAAAELKARSCLIDGEVVCCDSQYRDSKLEYAVSVTLTILVTGVERLGGDPESTRDARDIERVLADVPRNQNSGFIVIARALFRHCRRVDSYGLMRPTRIGALLVTLIVSSRARSRPMSAQAPTKYELVINLKTAKALGD